MGDYEATTFWNVTPRKLEDGLATCHFLNFIAEKAINFFFLFQERELELIVICATILGAWDSVVVKALRY